MKKTIYGLTLLLMTTTAQADLTGNLGYMSEYHFRGILQKVSSVSGGLDYESGGFYVGTWAADVGDGLEVDGYFGYGADVGDVSLSVGYTGYFYTGDFDDTYQEINLGAGIGIRRGSALLRRSFRFEGRSLEHVLGDLMGFVASAFVAFQPDAGDVRSRSAVDAVTEKQRRFTHLLDLVASDDKPVGAGLDPADRARGNPEALRGA